MSSSRSAFSWSRPPHSSKAIRAASYAVTARIMATTRGSCVSGGNARTMAHTWARTITRTSVAVTKIGSSLDTT